MRLLRMAIPTIGLLILMFAEQNETMVAIAYGFLAMAALLYVWTWLTPAAPSGTPGDSSPRD